MNINRRTFIGTASSFVAGVAASTAHAQQSATPPKPPAVQTWQPKIERLFKAPDVHPNALEAQPDGLWIGDQVSERVFKVDWDTGRVLHDIQTESHNTSGIAILGGSLFLGANGGVSGRRPPRPTDKPYGEVVEADLKTGKTIKIHPLLWGGGIHGITFVRETKTLWLTALSIQAVAEVDPKDFRVVRLRAARGDRAHGLDWHDGALYVLFAGDRLVQKIDPESGRVLEIIKLSPTADPDPHGMCIRNGYMYYCDAGLTAPGPGSEPGQVCRFKLEPPKTTTSQN